MHQPKYLAEIKKFIPLAEKQNPKVSTTNVAWQLDHSLKVIISIAEGLVVSKPAEFKPRFSLVKWVIMAIKHIPRGKSKAPKFVNNTESISIKDLESQLALASAKLIEITTLHPNNYFKHPIFGHLNLKQAIIFIEIHTNHHLKIF